MTYTAKIQDAIKFANEAHRGQIRKGKPNEQYIMHPLTVGLILAQAGASDDQIVAGILHDTIEDCKPYGSITKELIAKEFGAHVARMVDDLTEQDKTRPWMERKMAALAHIKDMEQDSLLVKSADVLQNLTDLNNDIAKDGDGVFAKFNANKQDTVTRFKLLIPELKKAWPDNPLMDELEVALDRLLSQT